MTTTRRIEQGKRVRYGVRRQSEKPKTPEDAQSSTAPEDQESRYYSLTIRELRVLELLTEGLADKEIAAQLGVTTYTVNKHVGAILEKMSVRSRTAAAVRAIRDHAFV